MIPGRRSVRYVAVRLQANEQQQPGDRPSPSRSAVPRARRASGTSRCESPAPMMIPAVNGRNASPASSGGVAEHALQVERVEVEHREEARRDEEHRDVRRAHRAHAEDAQPHERLGRAALDRRRTPRAARTRARRSRTCAPIPSPSPAPSRSRRRGAISPDGHGHRALRRRSSCARARPSTRARSAATATKTAIPTGTLTKKIHGHEKASTRIAAEQEPDRAAADGDRRPHAHRLRALGALRERRRDDRERGRRDERGAEPLQPAKEDQELRATVRAR